MLVAGSREASREHACPMQQHAPNSAAAVYGCGTCVVKGSWSSTGRHAREGAPRKDRSPRGTGPRGAGAETCPPRRSSLRTTPAPWLHAASAANARCVQNASPMRWPTACRGGSGAAPLPMSGDRCASRPRADREGEAHVAWRAPPSYVRQSDRGGHRRREAPRRVSRGGGTVWSSSALVPPSSGSAACTWWSIRAASSASNASR